MKIQPLAAMAEFKAASDKLAHYQSQLAQALEERRRLSIEQRAPQAATPPQALADALLSGAGSVPATSEQAARNAQLIDALESAIRAQTNEIREVTARCNREAARLLKGEHAKRVQAIMQALEALREANKAERELHGQLDALGYSDALPELAFNPPRMGYLDPRDTSGGYPPEWWQQAAEYTAA